MKILAFPKVTENPYQELLYREMRAQGDIVKYLPQDSSATINTLLFIPRILLFRLRGYTIFHMHWPDALALRAKFWTIPPFNILAYWLYILCVGSIKLFGYRLVWTAHNLIPHKKAFSDDLKASRYLGRRSDLIIVHAPNAIKELEETLGIVPKRAIVIPHGNYIGVYPNDIKREQARKALNINGSEFVYTYVGSISQYKGVDLFVAAYKKLADRSKILIAGSAAGDQKLQKDLEKATKYPGIHWYDERVPDEDLQLYFNSADVIVLPFTAISTSGSAILALSFGKAVIVPRLGDLVNLPDDISYKYSTEEEDGLLNAMKTAAADARGLQKKSAVALEYAQALNWSVIAKKTHEAMNSLIPG